MVYFLFMLLLFVGFLFLSNFIFLKFIYKLEIDFFDGFKFTIPFWFLFGSGTIFVMLRDYLKDGIFLSGENDLIHIMVIMNFGGLILSSIYNSKRLDKLYGIKISLIGSFFRNIIFIFYTKIGTFIVLIPFFILIFILDSFGI